MGGRSVAKKDLKDLYGGTGLDPEPKMRRRLRKKLKKKLKKAKSTSSASSGTSTSSSTEEVGEEILEDRSKVQRIAEIAPGVLTATSVQNIKNYVLQTSGSTWGADVDSIPPHHEPICEVFPGTEKLGWPPQRGHDAGLRGGPHGPGPSGCAGPAPQEPRAGGEWPTVGHGPKNRNSSTSRCLHGVSGRGADSTPGGTAGLPSEGRPGPVGEGQEQRKKQRQRKGQREEQRRHQRKGGEQKELLSEGVEEENIAWKRAPESEESVRVTKAGEANDKRRGIAWMDIVEVVVAG